jgi:hypothetical protein
MIRRMQLATIVGWAVENAAPPPLLAVVNELDPETETVEFTVLETENGRDKL